jgi:hypothetical protein
MKSEMITQRSTTVPDLRRELRIFLVAKTGIALDSGYAEDI